SIDEICEAYDRGEFKEMFASGTAAIISPVGELRYKEKIMKVNNGEIGPIAQLLYDAIYGTQIGENEDEFGWVVHV
ncbi:MAG: branched chain amino acid aminotransferase, partial [Clostridia bacterium]|nr:branched chain amino acid aminotransferase [Clostridia bacterium]